MRIAVLCNDRLGLPALQQLVQNRLVQAVATSDRVPEMAAVMKQVSVQGGVPAAIFSRKDFESSLMKWLDLHKPDVVLVKTFPYRIPASALAVPKFGFINFHYAPLPQFRGSNPLFWMIRERIAEGGITVHHMDEQFDSGPIILQQAVSFSPDATFGMCSTQLAYAGLQLTGQLLQQLQSGTLHSVPQMKTKESRWYGRPAPADLFINWSKMSAPEIKALVKACNPWLKGAPVKFKSWTAGISDASLSEINSEPGTLPGTIIRLSGSEDLIIACKDGNAVKAEVIYTEEGFFTGHHLSRFGLKVGDRFE